MEQNQPQEEQAKEQTQEGRYFRLIQAVGPAGRYQTAIVILSCILCFQNGFASLGTPYYFASAPYTNCPSPYQGITDCTQYACSLPPDQRAQFEQPQIQQLSTLGNQFGDYHCQTQDILQAAKGVYYLGGIVGVLISSSVADNLGRRLTLLGSLAVGVLGHSIVQLAGVLGVVELGMFLVGMSVQSCYNIAICLLSEVLSNSERQVKITLIQGFFCLSGIVVVAAFYLIQSWRSIFLVMCLIPMAACLVFSFFFVQETPQFLIKRYPVMDIRKSLKFIAKVNGRLDSFEESELLTEESLQQLKREYDMEIKRSERKAFTYYDLLRYPSLRKTTVLMSLIFVSINILYYAPVMLIDQFGFDFYLNGIIINCSELVTYFLSYFTVRKIKRRKFNIVGSAAALAASFVLIFLHTKQICTEDCWNARNVMELFMVFVMRFFVSFLFQILFVYITELYPTQVVGLAIGFTGVAGAVPVMFIPELIAVIDRSSFPVMSLFCMVAGVYLVCSLFLAQTRGKAPCDKVEEIQRGEGNGEVETPKDIELVEERDNP